MYKFLQICNKNEMDKNIDKVKMNGYDVVRF